MQAVSSIAVVSSYELGVVPISASVPGYLTSANNVEKANSPSQPSMPSMRSRVSAACISHALRDYLGQGLGRTAGLAIYCGLATLDELGLRIAAGVTGAAIGGRFAWRLASAQIGSDSGWQQAGVGLCTVLGAATGGTIAALGTSHPVLGIAAGSLMAACASATRKCAADAVELDNAHEFKAGAAIVGGLSGIAVAVYVDHAWKVDASLLPARNLGLVAESTVIETCKSGFERLGPSVERHALSFEGRLMVALSGMLPYVATAVLLNGYVSGRLQPGHDSQRVDELIAPALVGAIANAVRGASNALAVCLLHRHARFRAHGDQDCFRDHSGLKRPRPRTVTDKACVRYFLSACRNALYARLRDAGLSVVDANCIAQGVYACFAQCRDLINDLVRGDGWSEPAWRMQQSASTSAATPASAPANTLATSSEDTSIVSTQSFTSEQGVSN